MDKFIQSKYGYGVARLPIPSQVVTSLTIYNRWRLLYHPSFIGLIGVLLISWALRSCATTIVDPEKTIMWVQKAPTVAPEKIQSKAPAPVIPRPQPKEPEPIKPAPPKLIAKQIERRTERLMLEKPLPLPKPNQSLKRLEEKRPDQLNHKQLAQPKLADLQPAQKVAALSPQHQAKARPEARIAIDNKPMALPQQAPRALQTSQTHNPNVKVAQHDFVPLQPAAAPSQLSGLSAQQPPSNNRAQIAAGERTVAPPAPSIGDNLPAVQAATAARPGNDRGRHVSAQGTGFATDIAPPVAGSPAVSAYAYTDNAPAREEENVQIIGRVMGESPRIENLKRTIFEKAASLDWRHGPYCCTINGITCKLRFVSNQKISISFSQDRIPFEVLSKLERRLPEGLHPCAN